MKKEYSLCGVIIIIVTTAVISALSTGILIMRNYSTDDGQSYSEIIKDENIQEFIDVYSKLTTNYYENINKKEIIDSAISGMTSYLGDQYTGLLDEDKSSSLYDSLNAKYEGIGITIKDSYIENVLYNSSAAKAGLKMNDKIISINNINIENKTSDEIKNIINENKSNKIDLRVIRNNEILDFNNLKITSIDYPNLRYSFVENKDIGYIKIDLFSTNINKQLENALFQLNKYSGLIIDLRNNSGGYLEEVYQTAEIFLPKGSVIYSLLQKDNRKQEFKDKTNDKQDVPIVVLVNGNTASAAEILAAALKDSYGAVLVGSQTYGKGKVQHTYSLSSGEMVKYTASLWYRPNGTNIDGTGIIPDYQVENDFETNEANETIIIDNQYKKAIDIIINN
ncbi:MAG: S41 family peptidase [Bacilli bacterium]|nr:S41 family peptidase [Bacilli bacterium]MDY4618654.1 S41 family peptidase [Bacilli bacterium]